MFDQRFSDNDVSKRDIPSFIEPRPPLVPNPLMRPRPQKGTNLLELFEEDSELEESELVQVYLRLKPCDVPSNLYDIKSDRCLVTSLDTATAGHGRRTQHNVSKMYTFSKIFRPDCSQREIFEQVVKENLKKLPDGHNFTLLTYGASGSGKTYTLMGTVGSPGLVPRSLEYVFRLVDAAQDPMYKPSESGAEKLSYSQQGYELQWVKKLRHISAPLRDKYRRMSTQLHNDFAASTVDLTHRTKYYVWVSFVEIYNEAIYDLLAPPDKRTKLRIREDSSGNVFVKGATYAFVRSGEEAYDVMVAGKHNLVVAATGVHAQSSRSHCIFTINMLTETESSVRTSCVRLCDLAGCERARATRNTGARMQESRAINSSLHVLERCLHVLRRNQRQRQEALVPYRESKLTRLLGSGLSGSRGEAVSMVVTLNPAPQYAHETKHVLTLAAVAQDIQINNTMLVSTLETTQDTTVTSSDEVMRLRAENERLHFELLQAQARNKELSGAMEERQQRAADTMRELVEEAKDMTKQYYEAQLAALRAEMEDMVDEYESRLAKHTAPSSGVGTPSKFLQSKITQLMTDIAVLEEKLTAERLARARAEDEAQHLRRCIEERDEKGFRDSSSNHEDNLSSDESEPEMEVDNNDPLNESLEPVFLKETLNKTQALNDADDDEASDNDSQPLLNETDEQHNDSVVDKSGGTLKHDDDGTLSGDDSENSKIEETQGSFDDGSTDKKSIDALVNNITTELSYNETSGVTSEDSVQQINDTDIEVLDGSKAKQFDDLLQADKIMSKFRGTYFVNDSKLSNDVKENNNSFPRGPYFVKDTIIEGKDDNETFEINNDIEQGPEKSTVENEVFIVKDVLKEDSENLEIEEVSYQGLNQTPEKEVRHSFERNAMERVPETLVSKIINSIKKSQSSDSSLRQFEQLEMAANACDDNKDEDDKFNDTDMLKVKRNYFEDAEITPKEHTTVDVNKEKRIYFDKIDTIENKIVNDVKTIPQNDDSKSPPIIKDDVGKNFEPNAIKKLLGESFTKPNIIPSTAINKFIKKSGSVDLFESPSLSAKAKEAVDNIENARKSIEKLVLEQKTTVTEMKVKFESLPAVKEHVVPIIKMDKYVPEVNLKADNTLDEFEEIYKDVTAPRATEFDLLVTQEIKPTDLTQNDILTETGTQKEEVKYNLRHKHVKSKDKLIVEILAESESKCESKTKPTKRNLRLRRRRNQGDEEKSDQESDKLKDIVNLQNEFSDVTMGVPAPKKDLKDIASPEKLTGIEENRPPLMGIQSCPSKSITRSRRKLFTPRAEPLEESLGQTGDSNERVYVPRPSYHRARARRKL